MIKTIKKRDGSIQPFDADKLNKWAEWASQINGVDWASIALDAVKKCYDGCTTSDLQKAMITACVDREDEAHMYMAGRLYAGDCYKTVFGNHKNVPTLKSMYYSMILQGLWGNMNYSDAELDHLETVLNHDIDLTYPYTQLFQIKEKYAITDRIAGKCFETPQFVFMRVALGVMNNQPKEHRIEDVVAVYEFLSNGILNAPSPYMLYLGTNHRGLASCCVYISGDNIPSLSVGDYIAYMMTCASAGIGGTLLTRSKGDPVRKGTIEHLGKLPYLRYTESGVNANKQAGRGGAATMYYSVLDPELGDLLKLRHPTTVDEKKIKDIDYGLAYNASFIRRGALNQDWMLISYLHAPDLWHALYSADVAKFDELYEKYEKSDLPKKFVPARSIVKEFLTNSYEVGRLYEFAADNVNGHTPFKETIWSSNLCVAPETMILTDHGYVPIHLVKGSKVNIWNGFKFSSVDVVKTGSNQKLIDITTDSGQSIACTPYHKFYIFNGYGKPFKEVRAHELKSGDMLCKFDLPVIDGGYELENAYINGFYSGDGCLAKEGQRIYLYDEKIKLSDYFTGGSDWIIQPEHNRRYKHYTDLRHKFFVPNGDHSVKSKLDWLAGYLDADGCVYRNGLNEALVASSVELEFLKDIQLMLQTLGVNSKIKPMQEEGYRLLPANDGTGELREFWCQKSYRLLISSVDSYKLLTLGLKLNRLTISERLPQRSASHFIKVLSVVDNGRIDDTYCFTEHEIGMGMFNGLLTGQCAEIALVTKPFKDIMDLYNPDSEGEIGLCQLMAICAGRVTPQTYEKAAYYALLMIDNAIDIMSYPFPSLDTSAKARRSAGVGITNLAYDLAYKGLTYNSQAGKDYIHRHAEMHSYWLHEASLRLAKEKGLASWMHKTKYPDGWLPIDTYNRNVDKITSQKLMYDWEDLRRRIIENGGLRNSILEAHMPCESSSLASNTTNGLYPIRQGVVIKIDGNTKKVFIAPGWDDLKYQYQLAWSIEDNDMTDCYAVTQKFSGQLISADYYVKYNSDGSKRQLSFKDMFAAFAYRHKMGLGSRYYINSATGATAPVEEKGCSGGACVL